MHPSFLRKTGRTLAYGCVALPLAGRPVNRRAQKRVLGMHTQIREANAVRVVAQLVAAREEFLSLGVCPSMELVPRACANPPPSFCSGLARPS